MLLLAHFSMDNSPLYSLEYYYQRPIQLAGSVFLVTGVFLVFASLACTLPSVKVCYYYFYYYYCCNYYYCYCYNYNYYYYR